MGLIQKIEDKVLHHGDKKHEQKEENHAQKEEKYEQKLEQKHGSAPASHQNTTTNTSTTINPGHPAHESHLTNNGQTNTSSLAAGHESHMTGNNQPHTGHESHIPGNHVAPTGTHPTHISSPSNVVTGHTGPQETFTAGGGRPYEGQGVGVHETVGGGHGTGIGHHGPNAGTGVVPIGGDHLQASTHMTDALPGSGNHTTHSSNPTGHSTAASHIPGVHSVTHTTGGNLDDAPTSNFASSLQQHSNYNGTSPTSHVTPPPHTGTHSSSGLNYIPPNNTSTHHHDPATAVFSSTAGSRPYEGQGAGQQEIIGGTHGAQANTHVAPLTGTHVPLSGHQGGASGFETSQAAAHTGTGVGNGGMHPKDGYASAGGLHGNSSVPGRF